MIMGDKPAYPPWPHSVCLPAGLARGAPPPFEPLLRSPPDAAVTPAAHRAVFRCAGIEATTTLRVSSSQK